MLAGTLEWIRLPSDCGAYVIGKSTIGRHGLVIATATGVHPGFAGCLALEVANLGEVPIPLIPGGPIGQLFLHECSGHGEPTEQSSFSCYRRPVLKGLSQDVVFQQLAKLKTAVFEPNGQHSEPQSEAQPEPLRPTGQEK